MWVGVFCVPGMGVVLRVQVPLKGDQSNQIEAQLQNGDRLWESSVDRSRVSMNKNRIRGVYGEASWQKTTKLYWS